MERIRRSTKRLAAWAAGLVCAAVIAPAALEAQSVSFAGAQNDLVTRLIVNDTQGIALDRTGNAYITGFLGNLEKVTPSGTQTMLNVSVTGAHGLAVDPAGDIFIADYGGNRVVELPVSGTQTTVVSGLNDPEDIAIDAAGDLFVTSARPSSSSGIPSRKRPARSPSTLPTASPAAPEALRRSRLAAG